jgi:hypothetical protein
VSVDADVDTTSNKPLRRNASLRLSLAPPESVACTHEQKRQIVMILKGLVIEWLGNRPNDEPSIEDAAVAGAAMLASRTVPPVAMDKTGQADSDQV